MGLFWDLIQQNQISKQANRADSLEHRVHALEAQLQDTRLLLGKLLEVLEKQLDRDLDGDGRVG